jgi:hypothetical protein
MEIFLLNILGDSKNCFIFASIKRTFKKRLQNQLQFTDIELIAFKKQLFSSTISIQSLLITTQKSIFAIRDFFFVANYLA